MLVLLICFLSYLLFLVHERILLERRLRRIPLRIAVTGTRGKSSVVRLLASILKEDGRKVLAKTTGSQALLLLPDGSERELRRRGIPSIMEQKLAIREAARLPADCLIAEIMSLNPENHYFEAQRILKPHIVAVTNVRLDHTDAMGKSEEEIASVLSLAVSPEAQVFLTAQVPDRPFMETRESGGAVFRVGPEAAGEVHELAPELRRREFEDNLALVFSLARHLNIPTDTIQKGIRSTRHDAGRLRIWKAQCPGSAVPYYLVNAFAANDPESTQQVLSRVLDALPGSADKVIGVLNLRNDRADRTLQWVEALEKGVLGSFLRLFVTGSHCAFVRRRLARVEILRDGRPESMMGKITRDIPEGAVVFGFGNIKNAGLRLTGYWDRIGRDYGI